MTESELLERYRLAEPRAIATRAPANGDDYSRALLREQLEAEEQGRPIEVLHIDAYARRKKPRTRRNSRGHGTALVVGYTTYLEAAIVDRLPVE